MYLDTDVILALLKADDWLASDVDIDALTRPITSVATAIEVQYAMQDDWSRSRLADAYAALDATPVTLVPLTNGDVRRAGTLRERYDRVGVFDSVHLGAAWDRNEVIVSTDGLYSTIDEVEHLDPRELH